VPWVLDGNNLAAGRPRSEVRQAALALARRERVRIVLFFDGAPPAGAPPIERLGAVEVRYVADADAAIVDFLGRGGAGWRLATDDRELARRARALGAAVVSAAACWSRLTSGGSAGETEVEDTAAVKAEFFGDATKRLPAGPSRVVRRRRPRKL
jgi:hypothetical protein